jgi:hypothetical protein
VVTLDLVDLLGAGSGADTWHRAHTLLPAFS